MQGDADKKRKKPALVIQGLPQIALELLHQPVLAVEGPHVEEDRGVHQRLRAGVEHPLAEDALPAAQRQAPLRIARHHIAVAQRVAYGSKGLVRTLSQGPQPGLDALSGLLIRRIGIDHPVVLICPQAHFLAALTAQRHPHPGPVDVALGVRGAQLLLHQRQHSDCDLVVDLRVDPDYIACLYPLPVQMNQVGIYFRPDVGQLLYGRGPLNALHGGRRILPPGLRNVARGNNPDNLALLIRHGQVVQPVARHRQ